MGALLGLSLGAGLLLLWQSLVGPGRPRPPRTGRRGLRVRLADLIAEAGLESVSPGHLLWSCAGLGGIVMLTFLVVSRTWSVALAFGLFSSYLPVALVRYRVRQRRAELRDLWPDAVDNLASAVRAGLSLPEALTQLGVRGPEQLRRPFLRFGEDYRASGRFGDCLHCLRTRPAAGGPDHADDHRLRGDRAAGGDGGGQRLGGVPGLPPGHHQAAGAITRPGRPVVAPPAC